MFGTILRETAIVFIFCNIFVGGQEFLEYYKPKPGLPKELNAWLANVQKYEKDFRLIRAIAEDPTKFGLNVDEDEEDANGGDLLHNLEDDYLDYGPKNDIYPHVYKRKNAHPQVASEKHPRKMKSSFGIKSNPPRLRRHSDSNSFFERRHDIAVNPKSTNGEVKRSDDKYPDRYSNDLGKRDIQIDVLNDGKLVKQFRDSDQDPKSIVLSLQQPEQEKNLLPPGVDKNSNKAQLFDSPLKLYTPRSTIDLDNVPAKSKEYSSNFKNLFYANENLNTDSSIARDNLAKTALVYHVTLPDPNFLYQAPGESSPSEKTDSTESFNNNGFKDMSHFWTMSEKNQLQKGIDFAQDLWDQRIPPRPQQQPLRSADNDGFELVRSLVVDSDSLANKPKAGGNVSPNINSAPNVPNKRESETLEGEVDLIGDKKENCAGGKCSGIVHVDDVGDAIDRGERFDVKSNVIENEAPATTSIAIIDIESGGETLGNGAKPEEVDHQMPAGDQVDEVGQKGMESPEKVDVSGSFSDNENPGEEVGKMDTPADDLSENNPETLPGSALEDDSVQEPPPISVETQAQNLDSPDLSDMSDDQVNDIDPHHEIETNHEIDVEISKDGSAPIFKDNSEENKDRHHNLPLTRIHKLDQHIDEHVVVTRIETVTVLDQKEAKHISDENYPTKGEHPSYEEHRVHEEHKEHSMNEEPAEHKEQPVHDEHSMNEEPPPEHGEHHVHGERPVDEDHNMNEEHPEHKEHRVHGEHSVHEEHPFHEEQPVHEVQPVHEEHHIHEEHQIHEEHTIHENRPMNEESPEHEDVSSNEERPLHEEEPVYHLHEQHPLHLQCHVNEKQPEHEERSLLREEQVHKGPLHVEHAVHVEYPLHVENPVDRDIPGENVAEGRIAPSSGIKDDENDDCETDIVGGSTQRIHERQDREKVLNSEDEEQRIQKASKFVPRAFIKEQEQRSEKFSPKRNMAPLMQYGVQDEVRPGRFQKYRGIDSPTAVRHCDQGICFESDNSFESERNPGTYHNLAEERGRSEFNHKIVHDRKLHKHKHKKKHPKKKHKTRARPHTEEMDDFPDKKETEDYPTYSRRQLKSVEYVYDVDLESPKEEYSETAKGTTKRSEILHKNSVEGDYGDEEDSMTSKQKKGSSKLVKKTDNEFANPVPTTTEAEDDEEYNYEISNAEKREKGGKKDKSNVNKLGLHSKDEKLVGFGRHLHKKMKPPKKGEKPASVDKDDEKKKKAPAASIEIDLTKNDKFRQPRNLPSQKFLESSEFQQWPQFVRNDQINEENLRRRSINKKAHRKNNFPLASKDYFQKSEPKRSDLDKLVDKITMSDTGGMITEKSTKDVLDEKITISLYLEDKGKTTGDDITIFPITPRAISGGQTHAATTEDECEESTKVKVTNVCEENENFNRTKVALTTVLSIESENHWEQAANETSGSEEYERLDEILNGHLPLKILDTIYSHMQQYKKLEGRFIKGMKKPPPKNSFEGLQDVTNEESRKLVNAMANIMSRLQLTTTCQTLPSRLLRYLKSVTKAPLEDALTKTKQMEEVEFDDAQNQDNFIFQSNSRSDNLEEKVRVLKDLLTKFNHLPDRCKPRAEPVREYIENHLAMLSNMLSSTDVFASRPKKTIPERSDPEPSHPTTSEKEQKEDLVEKQLESLGLGKRHDFKPQFNLDELVEHNKISAVSPTETSLKKTKRESDVKRDISEKYGKLMSALEKRRSKRRVAETFGRLSLDDFNGVSGRREVRDSFESPVVYSF